MLIDDVTIHIKAGDGGRGAVAFNNILMHLGPTGADGGNGGNVYFEGISSLDALQQFQYQKDHAAERGEDGKKQFRDGAGGKDLVLKIPVGTVITNEERNESYEIVQIGQRMLAAKGGRGGRGNFKFRSSRNTTPKEFEEGTPGESFTYRLELKLIADVGLIGMPNAGKSSLLNALTGAHSKVANYPFTTLEPSLGVWNEIILADIPGLIAGAAQGKGLGTKFLRHIERTRVLFHLLSAESDDPVRDYTTVVSELRTYNPALAEKEMRVFLSKSDEVSADVLQEKLAALHAGGVRAEAISILEEKGLAPVERALLEVTKTKRA